MLYAEPGFRRLLHNMVLSRVRDSSLHEELLQQLTIHLWKIEDARPAQSPCWYRHSCHHYLFDLLGAGRSLDALKRRHRAIAWPHECGEPESGSSVLLLQSGEDPFSSAAANDAVDELRSKLACTEREVLELIIREFTSRDIAARLGLSLRTVGECRAQIRDAAAQLGFGK